MCFIPKRYKILLISILIVCAIIIGGTGMFIYMVSEAFRVHEMLTPFNDREEVEQFMELDLTHSFDLEGYRIFGFPRGSLSWVKFRVKSNEKDKFLKKNRMYDKLISASNVINEATRRNTIISYKHLVENPKVMDNWIPDNFIPISGYIGKWQDKGDQQIPDTISILLGKEDTEPESFLIFIWYSKD